MERRNIESFDRAQGRLRSHLRRSFEGQDYMDTTGGEVLCFSGDR